MSSISLNTTTAIHPKSLRCAAGLKLKSPSSFATAKPNLSNEFLANSCRSINLRTDNRKARLARFTMMSIGTPRVIYTDPDHGTEQWMDLWNALYRERVIFLGQYITESYSNQVLATMLYLDSIEDSKMLYLFINSSGGDISPSLAMYDTIKSLRSPLGSYCLGHAYNLAAFILAAGNKGHRLGMPLCHITIQSPAGAARGRADDIQNESNELIRIRDYLSSELSQKTGQPIEKVTDDLNRKVCFNAQDAMEYGIIDRIVRPARVKAKAPPLKDA